MGKPLLSPARHPLLTTPLEVYMAGSYHHLRDTETGFFRFDLLENLRDAYEACEECFFLIELLSHGDSTATQAAIDEYYRAACGALHAVASSVLDNAMIKYFY